MAAFSSDDSFDLLTPPASPQFGTSDELRDDPQDEDDNGLHFLFDYPDWNDIPPAVRTEIVDYQHATLRSKSGFLLYRFGSQTKRYNLIVETINALLQKIDTGRDHALIAKYLHNYLAHSVRLYARFPNDINSADWYVADESSATHTIVSEMQAKQIIAHRLIDLIPILDDSFLFRANAAETRKRIAQLKVLLKADKDGPGLNFIKTELRSYEKTLELRSVLTGSGKNAIISHFISENVHRLIHHDAPLLEGNTEWLPCPNGDVNLVTGRTRQRWLSHNVTGLTTAGFTVPSTLATTHPGCWSQDDQDTYFGLMIDFFNQLSGGNETILRQIVISLYLQLLGHNRDKYLVFWVGEGHNGKTLLLNLLRNVLGPLASSLHKSVLFRTKERVNPGHAGYAMQLTDIRSGTIDELSHHDEFDDQAVKRIVSAEAKIPLRAPGNRKQGAAKACFNISCSILMCYNDGSLPKFHRDAAMLNRIRIVRFPAHFVTRPITDEEHATGLFFPADTDLPLKLQDPHVQEQFLNFVICYGRQYYTENKEMWGEPLPHNEETAQLKRDTELLSEAKAAAPKPILTDDLKAWFLQRTVADAGANLAINDLAQRYCKEAQLVWQQPVLSMTHRLFKVLPDLAKQQVRMGHELCLNGFRWV